MGVWKKLSRALSGKPSSSKSKKHGTTQSVADGNNQAGQPQGSTISRLRESKDGRGEAVNSSIGNNSLVQLDHVSQPQNSLSTNLPGDDMRDRYPGLSPFASDQGEPNELLDSSIPAIQPSNIREVNNKARVSFEDKLPRKSFQRPILGKQPNSNLLQQSSLPSSSNFKAQGGPSVALTIIIDASLAIPKHGTQSLLSDIGIGVLSLLRALAPTDTVSIFGNDQESFGLFTFQADKSNYPAILDLVCKLHSQQFRQPPRLFEAIVMVVEELSGMDDEALKPLVIMSDYQEKDAMGQAFEAQHALLWSKAQNMQPILVSVWDEDLFSEIRNKSSKEVHMETLNPKEIGAAFLVMLSYLKAMIKQHKDELEYRKMNELKLTYGSEDSHNTASTREDISQSIEKQLPLSSDLNQDSPILGLSSPDIEDRKPLQSPSTTEESWRHSPKPSIHSDQKESEFDSTANFPTSSEGNTERDAVSLTDFAYEKDLQSSHDHGRDWEHPEDFKGFNGHKQQEHNDLFLEGTDEDGEDQSFGENSITLHPINPLSVRDDFPFEEEGSAKYERVQVLL